MQKYNDFAMPNLENIEQMAKAYREYEEKQKNKLDVKHSNSLCKPVAQDLYILIYKIHFIVDYLFKKYNRNENIKDLLEKVKKAKIHVESLFADYYLREPKDYVIADNTAVQDICAFSINAIKICLKNFDIKGFSELAMMLADIIELTVKY